MIATLFYNPITISFELELWLLLPLCAAVGLVYKTIRVDHISHLLKSFLVLLLSMALGLIALCTLLWAIDTYWPGSAWFS